MTHYACLLPQLNTHIVYLRINKALSLERLLYSLK